jgi:hypothetical protein
LRIVSLLPSATDIVGSLGLAETSLVGRTHECDWPPGIEEVPVMTRDLLDTSAMSSREIHEAVGTAVHSGSSIYALDRAALSAARPDLILTQELCEVCAVSYRDVAVAARAIDGYPRVVSLEPHEIEDILTHVELVGRLTGMEEEGLRRVARPHLRRRPLGPGSGCPRGGQRSGGPSGRAEPAGRLGPGGRSGSRGDRGDALRSVPRESDSGDRDLEGPSRMGGSLGGGRR